MSRARFSNIKIVLIGREGDKIFMRKSKAERVTKFVSNY